MQFFTALPTNIKYVIEKMSINSPNYFVHFYIFLTNLNSGLNNNLVTSTMCKVHSNISLIMPHVR